MKSVALTFLLVMYAGNAVSESSYTGFSGNDLMDWIKMEKMSNGNHKTEDVLDNFFFRGYVAGVYDATKMTKRYCSPPDVPLNQLIAVVSKHLENDPKNWNMPAWFIAMKAFRESWPCAE